MVSTCLLIVTHVVRYRSYSRIDGRTDDRFSNNEAVAADFAAVGMIRGETLFFRSVDDREDGDGQT